MNGSSITDLLSDFIKCLTEMYGEGDLVTEIKVAPSVFYDIERGFRENSFGDGPIVLELHTQNGVLTIKKDLTALIADKKWRLEQLKKEIQELENES